MFHSKREWFHESIQTNWFLQSISLLSGRFFEDSHNLYPRRGRKGFHTNMPIITWPPRQRQCKSWNILETRCPCILRALKSPCSFAGAVPSDEPTVRAGIPRLRLPYPGRLHCLSHRHDNTQAARVLLVSVKYSISFSLSFLSQCKYKKKSVVTLIIYNLIFLRIFFISICYRNDIPTWEDLRVVIVMEWNRLKMKALSKFQIVELNCFNCVH